MDVRRMLGLTLCSAPQVLYTRTPESLLSSWSLAGLLSLGKLADRLDLCSELCGAIDKALVSKAPQIADGDAAKLLLWADRAQFPQLRAQLIKDIVARGTSVPLSAFGKGPVLDLLLEMQSTVARQRVALGRQGK